MLRSKNTRFLPLLPTESSNLSYQERIRLSNERPEDCFVWWVEPKKSKQKPNPDKLLLRLTEIYSEFLPARLSRQYHNVGELFVDDSDRYINAKKHEKGALLYGPYVPLKKGNYVVEFLIKPSIEKNNDDIIFTVDVYDSQEKEIIVQKTVKSSDVINFKFNSVIAFYIR